MATTPDPATTEWVPLWDLEGGTSSGGGGTGGPHHTTHEASGTDRVNLDASQIVSGVINSARIPATAPAAHHTTHEVGGSDPLSNAVWTNQQNNFTQVQFFVLANAQLTLHDSGAPVNLRRFNLLNTGQRFYVQAADDTGAAQANSLSVGRSDVQVGVSLGVAGVLNVVGQTVPRVQTYGGTTGSIQPNKDIYDAVVVNGLAENLTVVNPIGVAYDTATILIRIRDNGTPRAMGWDTLYIDGGAGPLPNGTVSFKTLHLGFRYVAFLNRWMLIAKSSD